MNCFLFFPPHLIEPMRAVSRYPTIKSVLELPIGLRDRLLQVQERAGFLPNIFVALGHRHRELEHFMNYHDELMTPTEGGLTKAEREMIVVATSAANRCLYCVVAHGALLRVYGKDKFIADEVSISTPAKAPNLTVGQRAMLDFAVKLARQPENVDEQDRQRLREHFSEEQCWDIAAITSFFALSNRMATFLDLQPNEEFFLMGRVPKPAKDKV